MIKPIIACVNPYESAREYEAAGWNIDFLQPPESGDPLVGVSLLGNEVLLGITDGYVDEDSVPYIGTGVVYYLIIPKVEFEEVYNRHKIYNPTVIVKQPWGTRTFEVVISKHKYMIAEKI